jgi:DNA-binding MarR family transcriptional regulator
VKRDGAHLKSKPIETEGGSHRPLEGTYRLDDQIGFLLRQVNQRHTAIFAQRMGTDLTPTQWAALAKLYETGADSQNNLGRATAMDAATIKGVVDRLKKRGLVVRKRVAGDSRRRLVALTTEGEAVVQARVGDAFAISRETLSPLTEKEQAVLLALLLKMK